jgi:hypothetical protein
MEKALILTFLLNSTTVFAQSIACSVASSSFFVQAAGGLFLPGK